MPAIANMEFAAAMKASQETCAKTLVNFDLVLSTKTSLIFFFSFMLENIGNLLF
jgi:hypothetical protein